MLVWSQHIVCNYNHSSLIEKNPSIYVVFIFYVGEYTFCDFQKHVK
jgi:hypothetical protein